MVKDFPKV